MSNQTIFSGEFFFHVLLAGLGLGMTLLIYQDIQNHLELTNIQTLPETTITAHRTAILAQTPARTPTTAKI
ncbi:hypothetical protein [Candidatus Cyanaurora vandensis]|uniref:hypothetical protein n=1 Tax=Candidatus Cyanaurora vandensis TaxID=2714958 RepID=UPI00257C0408|nr:hypothetical protein [Candidatus Cyanaurora vandensis]